MNTHAPASTLVTAESPKASNTTRKASPNATSAATQAAVTLVVFPAAFGEPSASPFCVKAEVMCRLAGLPHRLHVTVDPRGAPRGKLPYLETGHGPVADSDGIRDYLEREHGADFDTGLTAEERAVSRAIVRMMEEHLYFAIVADRWATDANWAVIKRLFFGDVPWPMRGLATRQVRSQVIGNLRGQGIGRFDAAGRAERALKDVRAVADLLGEKRFLFGDRPTAADISAVTMLRAAAAAPVATEISRFIDGHAGLMAYLERGRAALYPQAETAAAPAARSAGAPLPIAY